MKKNLRFIFSVMVLGVQFLSLPAVAAQIGKVVVDEGRVREYPQESSRIIARVGRDEVIAVSSLPTEGFYKARLKDGSIGWISGNDVLVKAPSKEGEDEDGTKIIHKEVSDKKTKSLESTDEQEADVFHGDYSRFIFSYGLQYPNYTGLKTNFVTQGLSPGKALQAEFQFRIWKMLHWAIRAEYDSASQASTTVSTGVTQTIKQSSIPLQMGIIFSPLTTRSLRFGIGLYLGISAMSTITVDQTTSTNAPHAIYSSTEPCATLSAQFSWLFGKHWGLYTEAGYRYDQTGNEPVATTAFPTVPAFAIDYSGMLFRGGLEMRF